MAFNKYNNVTRLVGAYSAYYPVGASDWGVLAPGTTGTAFGNGNLTAGSAGSLATTTGAVKITFVTLQGESLPSAEGTVAVTGATGSISVALGTTTLNTGAQLSASPIIGWIIYSGSGSGNELANTAAASINVAMTTQTFVNGGVTTTKTFIPIANTTAIVQIYGTGAAVPTINTSGTNQLLLPTIATATATDLDIPVPPSFMIQKLTFVKMPSNVSDTAGVSIDNVVCLAPLWPASTAVSITQGVGQYVVINSTLFQVTVAGTTSTAPNFPAAFGTSVKGGTVTDNGATWTNRGKGRIVRLRYGNGTGSTIQPTAMELDVIQQ